jgi:diaminohydroxyphosphoribosylaminopyrimidine deaminase/5-amino-6-(5-phosphoribosylamino)uracil reductase
MQVALELARKGFPNTRPNPMVGAVFVRDGNVIAQGYHRGYGLPHAEIEALNDAYNKGISDELIRQSTLYVTLEPCCHFGKTPPCVDAIIKSGVKKVIVSTLDPNPKVGGKGIQQLKQANIEVIVGCLEKESRQLNKRFFTYHEHKRPYVILKWAQTADGFIARSDYSSKWISNDQSRQLVHQWRDQEMAIMVGTNTAVFDNPKLTCRVPNGRNPIRIVLDRTQRVPTSFFVFDESAPVIIYNEQEDYSKNLISLVKINFDDSLIQTILSDLFARGIQSLIVEGGAKLLNSFLDAQIWDEARVFRGQESFKEGIKAPILNLEATPNKYSSQKFNLDSDTLEIISSFN